MAYYNYTNNAITTLDGAIDDTQTNIVVTSVTGFPTATPFTIAIDTELLLVTDMVGTSFTVTRAIEGPGAAASHSDGVAVYQVLTAGGVTSHLQPYYSNDIQLADNSSNLFYSSGGVLADSSGFLYYSNGTNLTDASGSLYYGNGNPLTDNNTTLYYGNEVFLADSSGNLYYGNEQLLSDSNTNLFYGNTGGILVDLNGNMYYNTGIIFADAVGNLYVHEILYDSASSAGSSGQVLASTGTTVLWSTLIASNVGIVRGGFSATGTATTAFTVTIGVTQANTTYRVFVTPTVALSAALFYISTKSTTTFTVTFLAGLTGTVAFDWQVIP